jgi:hypothetical protein
MRSIPVYLALAVLAGCGGDPTTAIYDTQDTSVDIDTTPPSIEYTPITDAQPAGEAVTIDCTVTDPGAESTIQQVKVHYKTETSTVFNTANLPLLDKKGHYSGTIPGPAITTGGVDYYIEATDTAQNTAYAPEEGEIDPYHFRVTNDR